MKLLPQDKDRLRRWHGLLDRGELVQLDSLDFSAIRHLLEFTEAADEAKRLHWSEVMEGRDEFYVSLADHEREIERLTIERDEARYLLGLIERDIDRAASQPRALAEVDAPPRVTVRNKIRDNATKPVEQSDG